MTREPNKPKLLEQVRNLMRLRRMSHKTERAYTAYIREYILFHKRHPNDMGVDEIKSYLTHLAVEKNAAAASENIYRLTRDFPREEMYGLTSQIKRSATSIPANIAEGQGRRSKKEFQQFLGHARGSLLELGTHLELAFRFNYINTEAYQSVCP
jgi:four helix bundle protein